MLYGGPKLGNGAKLGDSRNTATDLADFVIGEVCERFLVV
jgi:hypothetical protein